eukprot:1513928-Pyramimonas_sp.AAC.1
MFTTPQNTRNSCPLSTSLNFVKRKADQRIHIRTAMAQHMKNKLLRRHVKLRNGLYEPLAKLCKSERENLLRGRQAEQQRRQQ